ncbi:unnamed protein product [Moritella viscosa]|nr:unnamed protein product [Moritella viscosa]SHO08718.1 unnamed protein product [Moritella viscosa]SHO11861.1 unnamed protein product [Moritella viscosa]SHO22227.1 unnamed protein product [Moritella viscosa]
MAVELFTVIYLLLIVINKNGSLRYHFLLYNDSYKLSFLPITVTVPLI